MGPKECSYKPGVSQLRSAGQIRPSHFIRPQGFFINNEKITYLRKIILVACNIYRNNDIT